MNRNYNLDPPRPLIRQPDGTFSVPDQEKKMSIPDHLQRAMLHNDEITIQ